MSIHQEYNKLELEDFLKGTNLGVGINLSRSQYLTVELQTSSGSWVYCASFNSIDSAISYVKDKGAQRYKKHEHSNNYYEDSLTPTPWPREKLNLRIVKHYELKEVLYEN